MSSEPLQPVYLLTGTDRPKVLRALRRLRGRFGAESVETLAAETATGSEAVAACNALGLFGAERLVVVEGVERWRAEDVEAVRTYCTAPVPGAVLALVATEPPKSKTLAEVCAAAGQVLAYDAPKPRDLPEWVRAQFERAGARADRDAARALVEIVGDDALALAHGVEKLAAWAGGEPVDRAAVELLATPGREAAAWAISDAWGARDVAAALAACEAELERRDPFSIAVRLAGHVGLVRSVRALGADGLRTSEIAKRLRLHEFRVRKALGHAENYAASELDAALVRLADLDAALKGGSRLSGELELQRALVDLVSAGETVGAAR